MDVIEEFTQHCNALPLSLCAFLVLWIALWEVSYHRGKLEEDGVGRTKGGLSLPTIETL